MKDEIAIKFTGDRATDAVLPAYQATESLFGLSKAMMISANYLFEGRVRRRRFEDLPFDFDLVATRPGSFEALLQMTYSPEALTIYSAIGAGSTANLLTDFVKSIFRRATGQDSASRIESLEQERLLDAGDLVALEDAIEPALRQAHRSIGEGANNIIIITGDGNNVKLGHETKAYVNSSIPDNEIRVKSMSVASFNANTGYGRVYDFEEGRTIPFQLPARVDPKTVEALVYSFTNYTRRRWSGADDRSAVAFKYKTILSVDGKVKKVLPLQARREIEDL